MVPDYLSKQWWSFTRQWLGPISPFNERKGEYSQGMSAVLCLVVQSCLTLWDPMDCSPPYSSIRGTLQARTLEWVAMPSPKGSSLSRNRTQVSNIAGRFFTVSLTREWGATRKFHSCNQSHHYQAMSSSLFRGIRPSPILKEASSLLTFVRFMDQNSMNRCFSWSWRDLRVSYTTPNKRK